jgi:hypothetical protein
MDAVEFRPIAAAIQSRWHAFPIPPSALAQYVADLSDLAAGDVTDAVESLGNDGRDRPPTPGQVRRRVVELQLRAPAWPEARAALVAWRGRSGVRAAVVEAWVCPAGLCDGSGFVVDQNDARDCSCRPARTATARGIGELATLLAEFVTERHVSPGELDKLTEGDTTLEAQVRARWEQFVRRIVDSRMLAALPDRGVDSLPAVAAARVADARRDTDGSLRRLDIGRLLNRGS